MKILVLSQYFPPEIGAPQLRFSSVIRQLKQANHHIEVVTAMPNHPTGKIFKDYAFKLFMTEDWQGIKVRRVWLYAALGSGIKRMINYGSFCLTSLLALFRCGRADYILVESPPLFVGVSAYIYSRLFRVPMILNVADLWPDSILEMGLMNKGLTYKILLALESWLYKKSKYINAVTEGIKKDLIEKKQVPESKILFLPNGVDTQMFSPEQKDNELMNNLGLAGKKVVTYAGTIGLAQGLDVVLEAAKQLHDSDIVFLLVGDGSDRKRLEAKAKDENVQNVKFLDFVPPDEAAKIMASSWAGVVTLKDLPLFEGARPSKIFPMMASGLPIVYSGRGEGARIIENAGAGLVATPEDANGLAQQLLNIDNGQDYGAKGRNFVEQQMSWNKVVNNWLQELDYKESARA